MMKFGKLIAVSVALLAILQVSAVAMACGDRDGYERYQHSSYDWTHTDSQRDTSGPTTADTTVGHDTGILMMGVRVRGGSW